jgi:predicted NBD/HSP70 family sugar kinase
MGSLQQLRQLNRQRLLEELRRAGAGDRATLAQRTGLSRTTVSALINECLAAGVILEEAERPVANRRGRRTGRLRLNPLAGAVVGADFGHRHLRVAVADLAACIVAEDAIELDVDADPAAALDAAACLVQQLLAQAQVSDDRVLGIGMGLPAPIDRSSGTVGASSILPAWTGVRAGEEITRRLGLPVRLENDANLGALSEFTYGAGRTVSDLVYVKVASGIGTGLVLEGALHTGAAGLAGELGHVRVVDDGLVCRCGNRGCLETVASATALTRALQPTHGAELTTADVLRLAAEGDSQVVAVLQSAGRHLGRVLSLLCNAIDPAVVVIGGELGAGSALLRKAVAAELRRSALDHGGTVPVEAATLGARAELLGALAVALSEPAWLADAGLVSLDDGAGIRGDAVVAS